MFAQVIQARARDRDAVREQMERWARELMPSADGFLGSTAGVDAGGEFIAIARFETEEAARRNSDRPEQSEWWAKLEEHLEGEARFYDSTDVEVLREGGSDDAGFVQFFQGTAGDRDKLRELRQGFEDRLPALRPDYIGGLIVWQGKDFTQVNYFTSEEEARRNESKPEMTEMAEQMIPLVDNVKWVDVSDPWMVSR